MTNNVGKIFAFFTGVVFLLNGVVFAHEGGTVSSVDLGVRQPLILPTNPLYILKEIGWDLERLFTFGKERKIALELEILNAKAAEIGSLEEKNKAGGIPEAVKKYERSAEILVEKIRSFDEKAGEALVANLTAKILSHHEVFGEILRHGGEFDEEIRKAGEVLDGVILALVHNVSDADRFSRLFEEAVADYEDGSLKEFNAFHVLDRIQAQLPEEAQSRIGALKDNLILRFEGRFKAESNEEFLAALDGLSLESPEEVKVLDEVREKIGDADLRSKLNVVRQRAFLSSEENAIADRKAVSDAISNAEAILSRFREAAAAAGSGVARSVKELLENSDFHLEQAKKFFADGEYGSSFGQATASLAEAESGLDRLNRRGDDLSLENYNLRVDFDKLKTQARAANLTSDRHPDIYTLFDKAEKQLLEAKTVENLRDVKLLLVEIEAKIKAWGN